MKFTEFWNNYCKDFKNQSALARHIGVHRAAITQAKKLDKVPLYWLKTMELFKLKQNTIDYTLNDYTMEVTPNGEVSVYAKLDFENQDQCITWIRKYWGRNERHKTSNSSKS